MEPVTTEEWAGWETRGKRATLLEDQERTRDANLGGAHDCMQRTRTCNRQGPDAAEHLPGVTFRPWHATEPAVEVAAGEDEGDRCRQVEGVQAAQDGAAGQGTVGEPRVHLTPHVTAEGAVCTVVEGGVCDYIWHRWGAGHKR